ncbi:hypothetical protein GCM10019017_22480 [Streptomyces showdoensis]
MPVLGRQRGAVHGVGDEHAAVRVGGVRERQAAPVVLFGAALDPVVGAGEDGLDGAVGGARLGEQGGQRDTGPVGGPDGLDEPGLADRAGAEAGPAVARALQGDPVGDGRPRAPAPRRRGRAGGAPGRRR